MGHGTALPPVSAGQECVILLDGRYAATYRFHDAPRADSRSFISHLRPRHQLDRILLVSGDRESEVRYLADRVGIEEVYAGQTPERRWRSRARKRADGCRQSAERCSKR